ncbi:phytochrome-interacting ankyrin-repeat protein [Anaeramoeba ignava]|uniref:Phytochrome-interacting ankyrin-repeat protein n=1 Tax=Anaeramoeba ignava TaxID=1746090 RepID=A0A9Q0LVE2_ANAIG|nr:phytochrome-interacting ankyrin-repeat protein [Anaeramoeba ignava]
MQKEQEKKFLSICREKNQEKLLKKIKFFIGLKVDINYQNSRFLQSPLHIICQFQTEENSFEIIKYLVENNANVNSKTKTNQTPLHLVCQFQKQNALEIIKYLIKKKADVNAKNNQNQTPLHLVCQFQKQNALEIVKYLVKNGANVNDLINDKISPLHLVCQFQKKKGFPILKFLVENGADINLQNHIGDTPLNIIFDKKHKNLFEMMKYLIEKGADINAKNHLGQTVLHAFLDFRRKNPDQVKIVKFLLENGADINLGTTMAEDTPLHSIINSTENKKFELVKILIENGAEVNARNESYQSTPLEVCCHFPTKESPQIVEYLIEKGALINTRNVNNQTPLYLAIQKNHKKLVEILLMNNANAYDILETSISQACFDAFTQIHSLNQDLNIFLKSNDNFSDLEIQSIDSFKFQVHKDLLLMKFDQNQTLFQKFINLCSQKPKETVRIVLNFLYCGFFDLDDFAENLQKGIKIREVSIKNFKIPKTFFSYDDIIKDSKPLQKEQIQKSNDQKEIIENFFKEIGLDSNWIESKLGRKGILNDFQKLYQDESTKDFTIIVEEKEIKVHKLVLIIRSGLFKGMFLLNIEDKSNQVHDYSKKSFETIQQLIYFFYNDKFDKSKMNKKIIEELEDAKDYYQLNQNSIIDLFLFEEVSKKEDKN